MSLTRRIDDPTARLEIHTSDRILYKRCRRKFNWGSQLRSALHPKSAGVPTPLWFGSGFHYALEDFHGVNKHGNPISAFQEYQGNFSTDERPDNWPELEPLATGMFAHYKNWMKRRETFETLILGDRPAVEVDFHIPLPAELVGRENVFYSGTIDRMVVDDFGDVWLMDYKTVAQFDGAKLEMDQQVSAYAWAVRAALDLRVEGMIYMEFKKDFPTPPKVLKSGLLSVNRAQKTTYDLFVQAAEGQLGKHWMNREEYAEYAEWLATQEDEWGDRFIRMTKVYRNDAHLDSTFNQIIAEAREMIDPDLPIYPNPTKDCSWDCPFQAPCVATDDGSYPDEILSNGYAPESIEERHAWREKVDFQALEIGKSEGRG